MLTWLGLALLGGAVWVAARWWLHRTDALGRPVHFPAISVVLLVALATASCTPGVLRARTEKRLSRAASQLVDVRVKVHCQTLGSAMTDAGAELGYVKWQADGTPEHQTLIKRDQCAALSRYVHEKGRHPSYAQIQAVHVLTHESMHMAGVLNEAAAECAAMQRDVALAELLGAAPADARALAWSYWTLQYPRMPDDYRSADCQPGGGLDEHRVDAPWGSEEP